MNFCESQLECTLINGLSINERENPVGFMFYGIYKVKHEQLSRNIQMNENVFLWIKIHFCLYITEYKFSIKHFTSIHFSRSHDKKENARLLQYRFPY